jgi:alanyl-tRNA synthetase
MTERLYYNDAYLRKFEARVVDASGPKVYLDRTAFYPTSGGQPHDAGTLGGRAVVDVVDEGERIAHVIDGAVPEGLVECEVDWARRLDYTQQHTGQHLLSAVFAELFGLRTVAVHFGEEISTIELVTPQVGAEQVARAEQRANEIVFENRAVRVRFADPSEGVRLRRPVEREGELRIVEIVDMDVSACGGTHVRSTAEIGPVAVRRQEKIRGNTRLEFVCGGRAARRAKADFEALSAAARVLGASLEEVPGLVASLGERVAELDKQRKRTAVELERLLGRELYAATEAGADGVRRAVLREAITEDVRARAQAFASMPKAVLLIVSEDPPAVLLAASKDSGVNAGERLKAAVTAEGGRGGGNAQMAQGSVPGGEALQRAVSALT